jgi:hypothetical protein
MAGPFPHTKIHKTVVYVAMSRCKQTQWRQNGCNKQIMFPFSVNDTQIQRTISDHSCCRLCDAMLCSIHNWKEQWDIAFFFHLDVNGPIKDECPLLSNHFNDHFEINVFFLYPSTCMTPDMVQLKMIALSCRMIFNGTQTSHGMNSCARLGHESVVVAVVMGVSSVYDTLCRVSFNLITSVYAYRYIRTTRRRMLWWSMQSESCVCQ